MRMKTAHRTLCIFMHYSNSLFIPQYVLIYLSELSNYFNEVILVTNERVIDNDYLVHNQNISLVMVKNEGYDFGMFYKVFKSIDPSEYLQIACINDSNVLFNNLNPIFEWGKSQNLDFWGLIDSYQKPWFSTHHDNYHIQSHFLVFNRKAIAELPAFFKSIHIESFFEEKDQIKLRRTIINEWEIGLTQFLISRLLTCGSYINSSSFSHLYLSGKITNVGHRLYAELIHSGYPLVKKKVITKSIWKDIFHQNKPWEKLIRQNGNQDWKIEELIQELIQISNESENQSIIKLKKTFWNTFNLLSTKAIKKYKVSEKL